MSKLAASSIAQVLLCKLNPLIAYSNPQSQPVTKHSIAPDFYAITQLF